jgi:hypothetical protein
MAPQCPLQLHNHKHELVVTIVVKKDNSHFIN